MQQRTPLENQIQPSANVDLFHVVDAWKEKHPEPLTTHEVLGQMVLEKEKQAHHQTTERLTTDKLTGLQNKFSFDHALQETLSQDFSFGDVLVYALDLDGFKSLNDRLGHDVADEALIEIGSHILTLQNSDDGMEYFVARTGGDEFMVIQKRSNTETVTPESLDEEKSLIESLVRDANESIEKRINNSTDQLERRRIGLSASIGVVAPRPGQTPKEVISEYEMALADEKTANKMLASADDRKKKRDDLVDNSPAYDELQQLISDENGDKKPFIESCRRYSDAVKQEVLSNLDIPERHRQVLDIVYGDSRMPGAKIMERIEYIQGRALKGYFDLSESIPEEADGLKQAYLNKSQDFSNELEGLIIDVLAIYHDKVTQLQR